MKSSKNSLESLRKTFANNILSTQEMKQTLGAELRCYKWADDCGVIYCAEYFPEDPVPFNGGPEGNGSSGGGTLASPDSITYTNPTPYTPTCPLDMPYVCGGVCSELPC